MTGVYTFRIIFFCIVINFNGIGSLRVREIGWRVLNSLIILSLFAIWGGSGLIWLIFPFPYLVMVPFYLKIITLWICFLGGILGYFLFRGFNLWWIKVSIFYIWINIFFCLIWYIPYLFTVGINKGVLNGGNYYFKRVDIGWNEFVRSGVLIKSVVKFSGILLKVYLNYLNRFIFLILWVLLFALK